MATASSPKPPPHPARRVARIYYGIAAACLLFGGCSVATAPTIGTAVAALAMWLLGGGALYLARYLQVGIELVQANNLAHDEILRGNVERAEAVLAPLLAKAKRGHTLRAVQIQRAAIALHRGDVEAAEALATAAIDAPGHPLSRRYEAQQIPSAHGLRALARAMRGDRAGAIADAERAEGDPHRAPDAVARARLARAMLEAKSDDTTRLAEIVRGFGRLREGLSARERGLLRAFERMTHVSRGSVYRHPAPKLAEAESAGLAAWVEKIAPRAASFVVERPLAAAAEAAVVEAPTAEGEARRKRSQAVGKTLAGRRPRVLVVLALWVVLVGLFVAIWQLLSPSTPVEAVADPQAAEPVSLGLTLAPLAVVATFVGLFAVLLRRGRAQEKELAEARLRVAIDDVAGAEAIYRRHSKSRMVAIAAQANLGLAQIHEERGDFHAAAVEAQEGITRASAMKGVTSDILLPDLVATRAFALAAGHEVDESLAELAELDRSYPTYPYRTRAMLRARIAQALARGDRARAAAIADERTAEMALTLRDELLCDLLVAWARGGSEDEREHLARALRERPETAAWVEALAPGLAADVARGARMRIGAEEPAIPDPADEADEEEAEDVDPAGSKGALLT